MFCSCRISTDKRVARSLCHSRATCSLLLLARGDIAAPTGLYARLCHAFLVSSDLFSPLCKLARRAIYVACVNFFIFFIFYYQQSYLGIHWTDFHDFFTKRKVFAWIFLIWSSFSDSSRTLPWQPILWQKWGKITYPLCTYSSVIPKSNGLSLSQCTH